ncbi:MAG: ATPase, T2SS/T4P/T4SS family [Pseudomonadota bacterium]
MVSKYASLFLGGAQGPPDRSPNGGEPGLRTLLFVDDEENVLSALQRAFRRENYKALFAGGGAEALKILAAGPVQVIVSDFKMPQMDGIALLRVVRDKYPQTIRIMLTGYTDVPMIMAAINEGAVYKFITKPWNDHDLRLNIGLAFEQYELLKENKSLREKNRQTQKELRDLSRLASTARSNLGKILMRRGLITADQLSRAEELQKRTSEAMPSVLGKLGFVKEAAIIELIKKELNIEIVTPGEFQISNTLFDLIPESYCRKSCVLPLRLEEKRLTLAMADPTDFYKIDDLRFVSGLTIVPVLARTDEILEQLDRLSSKAPSSEGEVEEFNEYDPQENVEVIDENESCDISELLSSAETPPAIRVVNAVLSESVRMGASDVHIEPKPQHSRVRFRVDGLLVDKIHLPPNLHACTVSRIKVMAGMDIAERRKPQDGRVTIRTARKTVDLRVSTLPTINGEKVVLRILDRNATIKQAGDLGIQKEQLARLKRIVQKPQGLFLVVGPTGSGKTTTLYAILRENATVSRNFVTIEDPVEYFMEAAEQVHVRERIGLNFASVLRSILRQDPDVIMLGEIRDFETAEVAFHAALTGHLVLSTIHANDTVSAIIRLRDIGIKPHVIAAGLIGIAGQRLVRRICRHCSGEYSPSPETLSALGIQGRTAAVRLLKGAGCDKCLKTGYSGRVGIFEILEVNERLRELIHEGAGNYEMLQTAGTAGMVSLHEDGFRKVMSGQSTCEELLRVLGPVEEGFCTPGKMPES